MRKLFALIVVLILLMPSLPVMADDYEPADEPENSTNNFLLDADNTGGDISIQFGLTLAESLRWNDAQNYFELSDALVVDGNFNLNGTTLRLDFDNVGAGADLDIIAEQGTDSDGTLRYSAANNRWEISNDGGSFEGIATLGAGSANYFDAYDATGGTNIDAGFTDVPLGTQRKITGDFSHTPGNPNVIINTTGTYLVHYAVTSEATAGTSRTQSESKLQIDTGGGFGDVPGSFGSMYNREVTEGDATAARSFVMDLNSGDELKIQAGRVSGTSTITLRPNGSSLVISRIEGIGPAGPQGLPGSVGLGTNETSFTIDQDEAGNPDQDVDLIAEQGSESNGILRYDDGNNRWEISHDGSTFQPFAGSDVCGSHGAFWAEEAGALNEATNGGLQYSFGNGNVNAHGAVMACPGTVVALTMNCEGGGAGSVVQIAVNGVAQGTGCEVTSLAGGNFKVSDLTCAVSFSANDAVTPITTGGGASGADGCTATYFVQYD